MKKYNYSLRSQAKAESAETSEEEFHETTATMTGAENVETNAFSSILDGLAEIKLTMENNQKEIIALRALVEGCAKPIAKQK